MTDPIDKALRPFPRVPIALAPTPIHEIPRFAAALGPNVPRILIKRDDLAGLALGGSKARKLEFLIGAALAENVDTLITSGAMLSNHAVQTVAAAARFGLGSRVVLFGSPPEVACGNMRLHELMGSDLTWVTFEEGDMIREQSLRRGLKRLEAGLRAEGRRPYAIPTGGSSATGALGTVRMTGEILEQLAGLEISRIDAVFFASGSAGTQAGLEVGARLAGWRTQLIGVEIDLFETDENGVDPYHVEVCDLCRETAALTGLDESFPLEEVTVERSYVGPRYGERALDAEEAARLLARTEGIFVDPIYTSKSLSALIGYVREGRFTSDQTILFLHTGGAAGLFV